MEGINYHVFLPVTRHISEMVRDIEVGINM